MPDTAPVLACCGLIKRYANRTAVDGVSFEIAPGECYGLLGPNGAGKTTTISIACGLLEPDDGEVLIEGERLFTTSIDLKAVIGYVPQEIALYPELSAAENLRFFGRLYGLTGHTLQTRITSVLEIVGLGDREGEKVGTFSGGMKRRANIAAGLLHEPHLLVLDEPTVGVDPQSRNTILETVLQLRDTGLAVLYTTHYMEEAERLCNRVGIIDGGRLVAEGTRRELVEQVRGQDRVRLVAGGDIDSLARACKRIDGVDDVVHREDGLELAVRDGRRVLPAVVAAAASSSAQLSGVEVVEPDLETVFLALTGKELRD
ncbi:MAG: ABC transporter ATP-binding protein [Acidimicrobiales bacterium]